MNSKIVGKFFQSESIVFNYENIDNPKFLNNIYFEKVDFEPLVSMPILHKKAKITDLISNVNAGGNLHLVLSAKLKKIIEKYRSVGLQFFKTSVIKDNLEYDNFFALNMYESNMDFIDFTKSTIIVREKKLEGGTLIKNIEVADLKNFMDIVNFHKQKMEQVSIENIHIIENLPVDFFQLKYGLKHIVSEKLKKEIEDAGCTGIEFQPIEISTTEWLQGGEREKIYGKA